MFKILALVGTLFIAAILVNLLFGCATLPTAPSPGIDPFDWWPEAKSRIETWLSWHPDCPKDYIRPTISGVFDEPVKTCEYNPNDKSISVQLRYVDGCMAHELGHAALHQAGNKCWREYEHDLADMPEELK